MNFAKSTNTPTGDAPRQSRPRPLPGPKPIRNPITLLLLWASKTDPRLLAVCSRWAMDTQIALGIFVFFTALLALGSARYTLSTVHASRSWALGIAISWSVFVFFLDREIVGSPDKKTAAVRPLLALLIGTLVAVPMELLVFQERVDQDLQRRYREDNKLQLDALHAAQSVSNQRRHELENTLAELRKQETDWGKVMDDELVGRPKSDRTGVSGNGPVFRNAADQQTAARLRAQEVRRDLDQLDRSMPDERQRQLQEYQREEIGRAGGIATRYEAMDRVIHSSDALHRLSWLIMLTFILMEMSAALLKLLTPHSDYQHLVAAEIRENVTRIDEISDRNYQRAMANPETPDSSVAEKFARGRYSPVSATTPLRTEP